MALYMIGFITYGATLVFYAAAFPRLARNTPHARSLRDKCDAGEIDRETYEVEESMEKNRISNISTVGVLYIVFAVFSSYHARFQTHSNIGYIVTLCLNLSVLLPLKDHPLVNNYTLVLCVAGYVRYKHLIWVIGQTATGW